MRILHIVGARPNFMKVSPVILALRERAVAQTLVHTGQHYDENMSEVFFGQLGLPEPDINLEIGPGTHAAQTGRMMEQLEERIIESAPDLTMVYGDVNSTLAGALVCAKLQVPIAHVEAGLRSFDRTMPEEINRIVVDRLSETLFTHSEEANANLLDEGESSEHISFVGNTMIDTLVRLLPEAKRRYAELRKQFDIDKYILVTLHRTSTVDDATRLMEIMDTLDQIARNIGVLFPVHPRTRKIIEDHGFGSDRPSLKLIDPLGYIEFLALEANASIAITDSGGVQEETTYLGIPCLTLRENTERPVTVTLGTNSLIGYDMPLLLGHVADILDGRTTDGAIPPLWDGRAAERIAARIT